MTEQEIIDAIKDKAKEIKNGNFVQSAVSLQQENNIIRELIVKLMKVTERETIRSMCKQSIDELNSVENNELYGAKFSQSQMDRYKASKYHRDNFKKHMSDAVMLISDSVKFIDNF